MPVSRAERIKTLFLSSTEHIWCFISLLKSYNLKSTEEKDKTTNMIKYTIYNKSSDVPIIEQKYFVVSLKGFLLNSVEVFRFLERFWVQYLP